MLDMQKESGRIIKPKRIPRSLVIKRLEVIPKDAFRKYFSEITKLIGNSPGIYVLYDGENLYYVGKSSQLQKRVKQHLRDRHLASWTHFSFYLVRDVEHIDEIESLLVRIANPKGNRVIPKGKSRGPLVKELMALVKQKQREEFLGLFGSDKAKHQLTNREKVNGDRKLKGLVSKRTPLYRTYKGREYKATLNSDGMITLGGKKYSSASAAAEAIVNRSVNGWSFWYIEDLNGDWIKLGRYKE